MKKILLVSILSIGIASCQQCVLWPAPVEELSENILHEAAELHFEKQPVNDYNLNGAKDFYPVGNKVVMSTVEKSGRSSFVYIYDMGKNSIVDSLMTKGRGPGEALSCMTSICGNTILFSDYVKHELLWCDLDSLVNGSNLNIFGYGNTPLSTFCPIQGGIIYEEPFCNQEFVGIYTEHYPRLKCLIKDNKLELSPSKYRCHNMSQGSVQVNKQKDRVVYVSYNDDIIEIYDYLLHPRRRIIGPILFDIKYGGTEDNPAFKGVAPYSYLWSCSDDKYFYVSYLGQTFTVSFLSSNSIFSLNFSYIMQFDWEGNLMKCYRLPYVPRSLFVKDGKMHITAIDEDGGFSLYSTLLPEVQ